MPARVRFFGSGGGGSGPTPPPFPYTPPLDAYPATAAYSVRKLSSTYSGSAIEAYRVSDGATQDIGFDGDGLLNTADIISFASGGEVRVRTWYDQTSNGFDAVGVSTGEYPVIYDGSSLITDGANPALKFISTNNSGLQITPNIVLSGNLLIVALANTDTASGSNHKTIFYANTDYSTVGAGITDVGGAGNELTQGWSCPPNNAGSTATEAARALLGFPHIRAFSVVSSVPVMECDGLTSTIKSSWTPFTETFIGRRSDGAFDYLGVMQEILVWDTAQASIIPTIESNLNSYYQVANLPDYTSGFLADYSDAAAAYSVRKLSNTAIKCMRVRRFVAPFDEKDIGFTAGGDLDEAAIVAFGGSDVLMVSAWFDQSGQSRHVFMTIVGSQPRIYDGSAVETLLGKPSINFLGTKFLTLDGDTSNITNLLSSTGFSHFAVVESVNDNTQYISGTPTSGTQTWNTSQTLTTSFVRFGGNIHTFNYNNSSDFARLLNTDYNGVTNLTTATKDGEVSSNSFSGGSNTDYRFNSVSRFSSAYSGNISEAIIYLETKDTVRGDINTNINTYYGIYPTSGFLFDYPDSIAAYSVRKLSNASNICMRVRRDSDNAEADVGFDSNGEIGLTSPVYDYTAGGPYTDFESFVSGSNGFCRTWYDQSRSGNNIQAIDVTKQPKIYDATTGIMQEGSVGFEKPALSFTADRFGNIAITPFNENNMGAYCVSRGVAPLTSFQTALDLGVSQGTTEVALGTQTSRVKISGTSAGTTNDTSHLLMSVYGDSTANEAKGFRNGTELISTTTTSQNIGWLKVGTIQGIAGTEWNGTIQEIVVFNTSTKNNDTAIKNNINGFYTIY